MARRPKHVTVVSIQPYEVRDAVDTVARARQHLANPKMVKAMRQHVHGLNEAMTGGLKPKPIRRGGRSVTPPRGPMGGL